ncbi:alpha/beta-Hydrolases superfamily protein [Actinidia rufa]|uniref:Alpha/beta-Hydrolases superfamily protein n=1 Tax=Actinidia rufa TaxID=165716 RepID=A0A7J0ENU3_9ERIC|nr:alpha/beta-Hydrolases superfamily protein [Actinidia rufa]
MPGVTVKLYSVLFKFLQKRRLETLIESSLLYRNTEHPFGVTARPDDAVAAVNPTFAAADGVATKDIHIDPQTSLSIRIFLPDTALTTNPSKKSAFIDAEKGSYRGYSPAIDRHSRNYRKLPVVLQFHGGGFVSGSSDAVANDLFCRRIAKLLDAIVIAVGYRLAPENRYPAAFEDGVKVLNWLGKQANLANCILGGDFRRLDIRRQQIVDGFGASMVEPWLAAHGDPSRCVLLGVSCGAKYCKLCCSKSWSVPTRSEIRLANSYFYDKAMSILVWKLFLPEKEFDLDHPAANPLLPNRETPLKYMPPTLTVVADHDWMRDRAIAYSEELRKVNVDAPVLDYKDTVHEFATLDVLLKTPQAQACAEDIAIWVKKYISLRGHEFSY